MENAHNLNVHDGCIANNNDGINPENGITKKVVTEKASKNNN